MPGEFDRAGWYPDPTGRFEHRYHNGREWTADVANAGQRFVDGAGIWMPGPPAVTAGAQPGGSRNGFATASLVLGIVALGIGWLPFVFALGFVATVLAIAFGVVGLRRAKGGGPGHGFALTGVITGTIGILVCAGGLAFTLLLLDAIGDFDAPEPNSTAVDSCTVSFGTASFRGSLTNDGDVTADFSVLVEFRRPDGVSPLQRRWVVVDDVDPGETVLVETRAVVDLERVDCAIAEVKGPLPFGIEP